MSNVQQEEPLQRRRPGRPRQEKAMDQVAARGGRVTAEARDGTKLSRKRSGNTDPYAIPKNIIPDGWDYQWNTYTVAGQEAVDSQILMAENGWRPVPASRHPGMFMPEGYKGEVILRGGCRLDERPLSLTEEAKQEDYEKAVSQVNDQNSQFSGKNFGRGFENRAFNGRSRAFGDGVRHGVEVAADVPRPRLEIDPNN